MTKSQHDAEEKTLEDKYLNKFVRYAPVNGRELFGKVDRITLDTTRTPAMAVFVLDSNLRYEEEVTDIHSLLTLL